MFGGVDATHDETAEKAGLPTVDALDIWPLLAGEVDESPRKEIPLSRSSLIVDQHKLIWSPNKLVEFASWTGPKYPNASTTDEDTRATLNCSSGCLFNVDKDPGEHKDLAAEEPDRVASMKQRLEELQDTFFDNNDKGVDSCPPDIDMPCACWAAVNYYGGFFGPYQDLEL